MREWVCHQQIISPNCAVIRRRILQRNGMSCVHNLEIIMKIQQQEIEMNARQCSRQMAGNA